MNLVLGNFQAAASDYGQAIGLQPSEELLNQMALTLLALGETDRAENCLRWAVFLRSPKKDTPRNLRLVPMPKKKEFPRELSQNLASVQQLQKDSNEPVKFHIFVPNRLMKAKMIEQFKQAKINCFQ